GGQLAEAGAARRIAERARGSARRAIQLAGASANGEAAEPERKVAREMLLAALSDGAVARLALASDRRPAGARAELLGELEALAEWLRDLLAVASGSPEEVIDPDALPILTRMVEQRAIHPSGVMRALDRIDPARDLAMNNVNPQLIVATLLADIQADLRGREIDGAA